MKLCASLIARFNRMGRKCSPSAAEEEAKREEEAGKSRRCHHRDCGPRSHRRKWKEAEEVAKVDGESNTTPDKADELPNEEREKKERWTCSHIQATGSLGCLWIISRLQPSTVAVPCRRLPSHSAPFTLLYCRDLRFFPWPPLLPAAAPLLRWHRRFQCACLI